MFNQNLTNVGLNTLTTSIPQTGACSIKGKLTLPQLTDDGSTGESAVVVTIRQNGTLIYTGLPGAEGFYVTMLGTAFDTVTVTFASAAAIDQDPNAVKATIGITSGQ